MTPARILPEPAPVVLVGDIGGTNARFALADPSLGSLLLEGSVQEFPVAGFPSLADAARHYLQSVGEPVVGAVFAVAGRVDGDEARITNHPWVIRRPQAQRELGLGHLALINDFTAQAMAISHFQASDVVAIGPAPWRPVFDGGPRNYAVIGPGTGLGVGGLLVRDGRCFPLETEGGHAGFPPGTEEEVRILDCLSRRYGRVSCERLVSGPGLVNIHRAICEIHGLDPGEATPSDISTRAAAGDPRCRHAVSVFCGVFGALAGDLALMHGAWDGVFLAGGLVPRLLPALQASSFRERFEGKGRISATMAAVPTLAVVHPASGLLGAAAYSANAVPA